VTLETRMSVWLETVPALLQRLDVKHVALVSHSAGTVYMLNTLSHHRSLLDPMAPYVAFLGSYSAVILHRLDKAKNSDSTFRTYGPLGRNSYNDCC
jgi:hypothetical protein